jgi:hypothetical protein
MKAAEKIDGHRHWDFMLILETYRHGFCVSDLVALQWDLVGFSQDRKSVGLR